MADSPVGMVLKGYAAVMTSREVATVTRLPVTDVRKLAADGWLPGYQVGREWRFLREAIAKVMRASDEDVAYLRQASQPTG